MSTLYLVATPIGNLGDLSPRAREILSTVDFIAAEDTRVTQKLLTACELPRKPMISYYEHNRRARGEVVLERMLGGETCALVTDAGTPAVGEERRLSLSRELTKLHEQTLRMTLGEAMRYFDENAPRGEFVLIVEGAPDEPETEQSEEERLAAAAEAVRRRIEQGQTQKDAVKAVSAEVGVKKNALYRYVLENE